MLGNENINTILIATRKLVLVALKAGKKVYTEKPLCINEKKLETIRATYSHLCNTISQGPLLMVGFNRRYAPLIKRMKLLFAKRSEPMIMHYRVNAGFKG